MRTVTYRVWSLSRCDQRFGRPLQSLTSTPTSLVSALVDVAIDIADGAIDADDNL